MEIFINRTPVQVETHATLAQVMAAEGLDGPGVAVAVDQRVVPRGQWETLQLEAGIRLTVIRAVCGG